MVHDLQQTLLLAKKHKFVMCNIVKIEIQKFKHSKVIKIMVTSLQKKDNNNKIFRPVFIAFISKIKDNVGTVMYWEKNMTNKKKP